MNPFRPGSTRFPPHDLNARGDIRRYPVFRHDDGRRQMAGEVVFPASVR